MRLQEDIREKIKNAMRERDEIRLLVLRGLIAAFTNELVAKKKKPSEELSDEDALLVISREAKKRKDSIEQFRNGNREDLAKKEEAELAILEEFLPEMLGEDEVRKIVEAKKNELGINDRSKIGILMGAVMGELRGKADGGLVKSIVDSVFE